jgi:hypothetical protein
VSDTTTTTIDPITLLAWLQDEAGVPVDRAAGAATELAASWNDGDLDYQTARDILGDHLADEDPRPKLIADDLAAHVGLELEG